MAEKQRFSKKTPKSQEENFKHLQPQAPDLEAAVLGCIMVEHEALNEVANLIKPESFYDPRNKMVFEAILALESDNKPVDQLTVTEKLQKLGYLDEVGGPAYIAQLAGDVSGSADVEYYAGIIAQKFLARQLITFSSKVQTDAFDPTKDVVELMQETESGLFELSQSQQRKDYTPIDPVVKEAYKMLQDAATREGGLTGVSSGFRELDKMTSGWQKSDLVIIAARPAMGKTAFALSMAKNIAVDNEIPMALFSLEMSNLQLVNRLITNVCEIDGEKIRSGHLLPYEWPQLDSRIKQLYGKPLYIDDTPQLSIYELCSKARRLQREKHIELIMIDYLQLMNASGSHFGSRQEEVSNISRALKGLAKELGIPILALSQLNRSVEQRDNSQQNVAMAKRPQLSDLRESGAIEQDADIVCFIHRPEYYGIKKDESGNDLTGKAQIIIAKHRNGAVGDVLLSFKSNFAKFLNPDDEMAIVSSNAPMEISSKINNQLPELPEGASAPPDYTPDPLGGLPADVPF